MPIPQTRSELEHEVSHIVAGKLGLDPDKIRMDDDLIDNLGADSLALAELTLQLEVQMGIRVPGEEWLDVVTVSELLDLIERHQQP